MVLPPAVTVGVGGFGYNVTCVEGLAEDVPPALVAVTVYIPAAVAVYEAVVAPVIAVPFRYHWKDVAPVEVAVSTTLPPWQNEVLPPAVIAGVGGAPAPAYTGARLHIANKQRRIEGKRRKLALPNNFCIGLDYNVNLVFFSSRIAFIVNQLQMSDKKPVESRLQSQVILVTGASSGIGKESVITLLARGHIVYGGARRLEAMEDIKALGARVLFMDMTREETLTEAVSTVLAEQGRIDALVNNAGYGSTGAIEDVPLSEASRQFSVNVFGLARLTQLVLPSMRFSGFGTIVNLSSVGGRIATPMSGWYNATKYSVEALSDALRHECRGFGIRVAIIEPGGIATGWTAQAEASVARVSGHTAYAPMAARLLRVFADYGPRLSHPSVIASLIVRAIEARRPRRRYVGGFGARGALLAVRLLPSFVLDRIIGWQLGR